MNLSPKDNFISFGLGLIAALMTLGMSVFFPLSFFLAYFIPLPFFMTSLVYGFKGTIIASISGTSLVTIIYGPIIAAGFLVINAFPALWYAKRYKGNLGNIISEITITATLLFLILGIFYSDKLKSFIETFNDHLIRNFDERIIIPISVLNLLPSIIIATWIVIVTFNLIISKKIVKNFKISNYINSNEFIYISLPPWIVYLFIIFLIFSVIMFNNLATLTQSIALILSVPISLQGFATIQSKLSQLTLGKFLTGIFYIIVLLIPFILAIITAIGILEHFYNFRKLSSKNDKLS